MYNYVEDYSLAYIARPLPPMEEKKQSGYARLVQDRVVSPLT